MTSRWHSRDGVTSRLRLRGHDYTQPGAYFVTICTEQRLCLLGEIGGDDTFRASPAGAMIAAFWTKIPDRYPHIELDDMVVMPNHVHGILFIPGDFDHVQQQSGISQVMQWFKSITTVEYTRGVKQDGWPPFPKRLWQPGFHDHIVRNDRDLKRLRDYMDGNPANWVRDTFHMSNPIP